MRRGLVGFGWDTQGTADTARHGGDGIVGFGAVRQGRRGTVRLGKVGLGRAWNGLADTVGERDSNSYMGRVPFLFFKGEENVEST